MKMNGKTTLRVLPTTAAAALCFGLGASVLAGSERGNSDASLVSHFSAAHSGNAQHGTANNPAAIDDSATYSGGEGVPAGRRAAQGPQALSGNPTQTLTFDVSGIESIAEAGNPLNEVFILDLAPGAVLTGVGWDVTIEALGTSWLSEMVFQFTDNDPITDGVAITVGVGDDGPGVESYSSDGILNLADADLAFALSSNGEMRLEFFESFVDFPTDPDGIWLSGELTFEYVVAAAPCPGDLNGDGNVAVGDLLILLSDWGPCPGCASDLNGDGVVNVADMLILLGNWGACPGGGGDAFGACCYDDFTCNDRLTEAECNTTGGTFGGDYTSCAICPQQPDGETCATALPIDVDGTEYTVDLTGFPSPSVPACAGLTPTGETAWFAVEGVSGNVTVDACSDGGDARVAVYCGSCEGTLECLASGQSNAPASCADPFNGSATWCADPEAIYYIAVWRNSGVGEVTVSATSSGTCTPTVECDSGQVGDPVCTLSEAECQLRAGGTYTTSDTAPALQVADDFNAAVSGNITSVCWQGVELGWLPGFGVCSDNNGQGNQFRVTYYDDAGGIPGNQIAQFTGNPDFERIDFIGFGFGDAGLIDYTMEHDPVAVTAGQCYWIEIVQINTPNGCYFLWSPSDEGNQIGAQTDLDTTYSFGDLNGPDDWTNPDRSFCINIDRGDANDCLGDIFGACCEDGNCSQTLQADCDGIWIVDTPCGAGVCPTEAYVYDSGATTNSLGWGDGGVFMWMHRFDVDGGSDVINTVSTSFNFPDGAGDAGVSAGQIFGVAIMEDTGAGPGAVIWQDTANATADAVNTDALQSVSTGGVNVSGSFYVAAWVEHAASTFPSPMDESQSRPDGDVFFAGTVSGTFGTFDPTAPGNAVTDVNTAGFPTTWLLRAD